MICFVEQNDISSLTGLSAEGSSTNIMSLTGLGRMGVVVFYQYYVPAGRHHKYK
jgi:hypothetical protein